MTSLSLDQSMITLIRETLRPLALAAETYDKEYPGHNGDWKPCGVLQLTVDDLRSCRTLLAQLEDLTPTMKG